MVTSIQQASANAAVAYLRTALPGVLIHPRWPTSDFQGKTITLITAGARRDQAINPRLLSNIPQGDNQTVSVWQVALCTQPFQLDVWAQSFTERDDIVAQLDTAFRAGRAPLPWIAYDDPVSNGFFVPLADGWDGTAYFSFDTPDYEDSPDSVKRNQYRATFRGDAYMTLAITAPALQRIKQIKISAYLDGPNSPPDDTLIP